MSVRELTAQDEIALDIFNRLRNIPLVDKYAAYQALANNWQMIVNDIETIQQDGLDAAREVETAYKIVKKNDEEIEVPDGVKGRIIPFDLVQHEMFQTELNAIAALQQRVETIASELDELHESFTDEEIEAYCDSEKDNAFNKSAIKADAKPKADVEQATKAKLKKIVALWDEQTKTNKQIKADIQALVDKTIETLHNLTDEEANKFLHLKWIVPVCEGINTAFSSILNELEASVLALGKKYAVSYKQIKKEINSANNELEGLVNQLTGDEFSIKGLIGLIKE